ncbi:MAG: hypothetical protein LWX52_11725 [Deltaproteobacteria bacterium]|nr:hypothetical protein [Deltaproteobacteria bacterium]
MLEEQINDFIRYCKVSGFRDKSIESLSIRLKEFNKFLKTARLRKIKSITYRHLSSFIADYKNPSIHVKKARVWSLRQFFHYLKLNGYVDQNIALDLPYPKIEKTVPHFLTVHEYNRILHHCSKNADTHRPEKSHYHYDAGPSGASNKFDHFHEYSGCGSGCRPCPGQRKGQYQKDHGLAQNPVRCIKTISGKNPSSSRSTFFIKTWQTNITKDIAGYLSQCCRHHRH